MSRVNDTFTTQRNYDNGETLLGTCVTDSNGEYSFDYTPLTDDDLTIRAVYNGSTYFDNCESSTVSVTVNS